MKFTDTATCLVVLLSLHHDGTSAFHVIRRPSPALRTTSLDVPPSPSTRSIPPTTALNMFGSIFGGSSSKLALDEPITVYSNTNDAQVQFEGLGDYIVKWSNMFTNGGIKLTTPVQVVSTTSENSVIVRLLFKDTKTGYKTKNEENESGKNRQPSSDAPKKKKDSKGKQGGVEIVVKKIGKKGVQVVASRCEIDEDTIIKEMSEETIMSELKQAIDVWKRETKASKS